MSRYFFTSESVSEGHPDKLCDQISDALVDAYLAGDPNSRVACETFTTENFVGIMGEISTNAWVDAEQVARQVIREVGYVKDEYRHNRVGSLLQDRCIEETKKMGYKYLYLILKIFMTTNQALIW